MSFFSKCESSRRKPLPVLPVPAMLKVFVILGIFLLFGLAHLFLRFELHRMRLDTNRMQTLNGTLVSSINALRGETEALKRPEALLEYARNDLKMEYYSPTERQVLRMPEETYARYAMARSDSELETADAGGERERNARIWLEAVGERMGFIAAAMANENDERR